MLAFALAALLYLVTEELLAEAHETPDVPLVTALFFAGFLRFLLLGMPEWEPVARRRLQRDCRAGPGCATPLSRPAA